MTLSLTPDHLRQLTEESVISLEVIAERDPRSLSGSRGKAELTRLDFPAYQQRVPGILFPVHTTDGQVLPIVWRPDDPRVVTEHGKGVENHSCNISDGRRLAPLCSGHHVRLQIMQS